MKSPDDYRGSLGTDYEPPDCTGRTSIEVLSFLKGRKWDSIALAYVHALRPSQIRVTDGGVKANARTWRVTVYTDKQGTIQEISQEVEVGLPDGIEHGHALDCAVKR